MRAFKRPIIDMLVLLQSDPVVNIAAPEAAQTDLLVWAGMLSTSEWLPVPREPGGLTLRHKLLTADAAGVVEGEVNDGAGVGGVGLDEDGMIITCFQYFRNNDMICFMKDLKGADSVRKRQH